jgi:MarR family transcriptional regulator, 2-MHQ and catechol-resistance regulon repressor
MAPKQLKPAARSLADQVIEVAEQPSTEAARGLLRAAFLFSNQKERPFLAYDLNLAQVDVLSALGRAEGNSLNCSEIAEKTLITKGGITGIIDRLEARGLVKRVDSQQDRRSVLIQLTTRGVEFVGKFYPELGRHNRTLMEKACNPSQLRKFNELLAQLIRTLEAK